MQFVKYQGTGNDFILIDNRERLYDFLDVKTLITNMKPIEPIQLITEIDHQKLKSKQNLIF